MAQVFPTDIPADVSATKSERALFAALKHELSDDYFVYCAMPFIAAEFAEQGEVDFIILHPEKGMLFLECKGGGVERDHDGTWYRRKGKKRERLSRSPAEQAKKQVEALVTKFRKPCCRLFGRIEGRFPMVYGWALAFPFTSWTPDEIPPDVESEIFLDAELLTQTQQMIEGAFEFWHRGHTGSAQLSPEQFETFRRAVLSPEVKLVPNFGGALKAERHQMVRLNQQQAAIAEKFAGGRRIMVDGGSGAGKTLLALHCAQRMANEDKRVLLLCASRDLAMQLRQTTDELARQIQIAEAPTTTLNKSDFKATTTAFQRVDGEAPTQRIRTTDIIAATKALEQPELDDTTIRFQRPDLVATTFHVKQLPGTIETYFFGELCAHAAMLLGQPRQADGVAQLLLGVQQQRLGPWDTIIIDQAEDFSTEAWEVLESSVAPGGQMAVFYDSSVSNRFIPKIGPISVLPPPTEQTVSQVIRGLDTCVDATHIVIRTAPETGHKELATLLHELIETHGVKFSQIAILTPDSSVDRWEGEVVTELCGVPIVRQPSERDKGVLQMPIGRFSGLESDIIILVECPSAYTSLKAYRPYLNDSRPCLRLYAFVPESTDVTR